MTSSRFGVGSVREAARKRVADTSLRATADEIGMSFSGLRSFLEGGNPHPATRGKLAAWYAKGRGVDRIPREDVQAAIALIAEYIRQGGSLRARRRVREVFDQLSGVAEDV